MKRLFLCFGLLASHAVWSDTIKKVTDTPVSTSMKHVLQTMTSEKLSTVIAQQKSERVQLVVKTLHDLLHKILVAGSFYVQDAQAFQILLQQMKEIVAYKQVAPQGQTSEVLQELCIDAVQLLDTLVIGGVDEDIAYIKDSLLQLCYAYQIGKPDQKVSLRTLAIIQELLSRYDGVLISAYTMLVLKHAAYVVFLLQVV